MTDILLALILVVLVLTYLNWTPGNVLDYLGWRRSQFGMWLNGAKAKRRKGKNAAKKGNK